MRSFIICLLVSSIICIQGVKVKSFIDFLRQKTTYASTTTSTTTPSINHIPASPTSNYNNVNLIENLLIAFISAIATSVSGYGFFCICKCVRKRRRTKCVKNVEYSNQQDDQSEIRNETMGLYIINNNTYPEEFQL